MWHASHLTVVALVLGCWISPSAAADSLAKFVVDENSIEAQLRLPEGIEAARYEIHCEAAVLRTGTLARVFCYSLDTPVPRRLLSAVSLAANRAKFVPAVREGEQIDVYMMFMVLIDTRPAEPLILAVPNNGVEKQKYGLLYAAPQRILKNEGGSRGDVYVSDGMGRRMDQSPDQNLGGQADMVVWMQFVVDERGDVQDYRLDKATKASDRIMRYLEKRSRETKFLPGSHERRTKAMIYAEPFFSIE